MIKRTFAGRDISLPGGTPIWRPAAGKANTFNKRDHVSATPQCKPNALKLLK